MPGVRREALTFSMSTSLTGTFGISSPSLPRFLYLPIAPLLASRAADIRVVAALPLIAGTALTSFGLFKGLEFLSAISPHFGRGAVAAFWRKACFRGASASLRQL